MVKTKVYPNKESFEARIVDKEFGTIRKVFKDKSDAEQFCDEQRQIFEDRRAKRKLGLSEKSFTPKRIDEAIKSHVDEYLHKKSGGAGTSHNRILFGEFHKFIHEKRIVFCHEVTLEDLEDLQAKLTNDGLSGSSVNRYFASYGGFFTRCMKKKYVRENPMQYLERKEVTQKRRLTWTGEEVQAVKSELSGWHADFFEFLFTTGCRPIEGANLTRESICFKTKRITFVSRKGNSVNEREFPLTTEAAAILKRNLANGSEFVFQNLKGNKVNRNCFAAALRRAGKRAGVRKGLVAYGLRHTFVSELVANDVSTMKVQKLAGHKRSQTTQNYVSLLDENLRSTVTDLADFRKRKIS